VVYWDYNDAVELTEDYEELIKVIALHVL